MRARALALCAWALSSTSPAFSQPTASDPSPDSGDLARKRECISAHAAVQRSRAAMRLAEARRHATSCNQAACPAVLRSECDGWLTEIAAEQPTVILAARDGSGRALEAVTVREGNTVLAQQLGGQDLELDPGLHTLRFEHQGAVRERQVLVRAGEKRQRIEVVMPERTLLEPPRSPRPAQPAQPATRAGEPSLGLPTASWVLGGVAAAGFLSAGYFGISGLRQQRDMEATCAPRCASGDIDAMQRSYLVADISLGVALAATAGAIWVALSRPHDERGAAARSRASR